MAEGNEFAVLRFLISDRRISLTSDLWALTFDVCSLTLAFSLG